jgi:hypothetical protein
MTGSSAQRHRSPRIFTTMVPREALLARIDSNGETEKVVDPERLGEVTEVPRRCSERSTRGPTPCG